MSAMSEMTISILEMHERGVSPERIAIILDIPVKWVVEAIVNAIDEFSPFVTVNS